MPTLYDNPTNPDMKEPTEVKPEATIKLEQAPDSIRFYAVRGDGEIITELFRVTSIGLEVFEDAKEAIEASGHRLDVRFTDHGAVHVF